MKRRGFFGVVLSALAAIGAKVFFRRINEKQWPPGRYFYRFDHANGRWKRIEFTDHRVGDRAQLIDWNGEGVEAICVYDVTRAPKNPSDRIMADVVSKS